MRELYSMDQPQVRKKKTTLQSDSQPASCLTGQFKPKALEHRETTLAPAPKAGGCEEEGLLPNDFTTMVSTSGSYAHVCMCAVYTRAPPYLGYEVP